MTRIALLIDLPSGDRYHDRTVAALRAAAESESLAIDVQPIHTSRPVEAAEYGAVLAGPGSPYAGAEGVLAAIRECRERLIPFLGT